MVASASLDRFNADVGRALEFQRAPVVELKVGEGLAKWHLAWEVRKHRRGAIRPLSPSLTGTKLRRAIGDRARCGGKNSVASRSPRKKERLAIEPGAGAAVIEMRPSLRVAELRPVQAYCTRSRCARLGRSAQSSRRVWA